MTAFSLQSTNGRRFHHEQGAMSITFDIAHLREFGWVRIRKAIPVELCNRLLEVLETELRVPVNDPSRWDNYGGEPRDFVPINGTFGSIRTCIKSGRSSWELNDCACRWIRAASPHRGSPAMPSHTASIGITILGIPRSECSKAFWR